MASAEDNKKLYSNCDYNKTTTAPAKKLMLQYVVSAVDYNDFESKFTGCVDAAKPSIRRTVTYAKNDAIDAQGIKIPGHYRVDVCIEPSIIIPLIDESHYMVSLIDHLAARGFIGRTCQVDSKNAIYANAIQAGAARGMGMP